jgi:hypothetical protein
MKITMAVLQEMLALQDQHDPWLIENIEFFVKCLFCRACWPYSTTTNQPSSHTTFYIIGKYLLIISCHIIGLENMFLWHLSAAVLILWIDQSMLSYYLLWSSGCSTWQMAERPILLKDSLSINIDKCCQNLLITKSFWCMKRRKVNLPFTLWKQFGNYETYVNRKHY